MEIPHSDPQIKAYLVRHGQTVANEDRLSDQGREDARTAALELRDRGLDDRTVLLHSNLFRTTQTALIIADLLGVEPLESQRVGIAGNYPDVIDSFDHFLHRTLSNQGVDLQGRPVIVVTHAPMVALAKGLRMNDTDRVSHGEVVRYDARKWRYGFYNPNTVATNSDMDSYK